MIRNLPTKLLIVMLDLLVLLMYFLLSSQNRFASSILETKVNLVDKSKQKTVSEFNKERKNYAYVSFDNLYSNTSLYYGAKIYQNGHIKNVDMDHNCMLVALDGNDESRTIKLKYSLSDFERRDTGIQRNTPIKFYGRVLSTDRYINEKGRGINRPVISADFIQTQINKQGESDGIV